MSRGAEVNPVLTSLQLSRLPWLFVLVGTVDGGGICA